MALAIDRIRLQDITIVVTGGGTLTEIRNLRYRISQGTAAVPAADDVYERKVLLRKDMSGSFEVWRGTGGVPPTLGATLTPITVSVGADEVSPATIDDAAVYGAIKVTSIDEVYDDPAASYTVNFEGGF